jgi:uncharacterized protein YcbK (DUF882 family)
MRLTDNFNLDEFERANRKVPPELLPNIQRLAENLQRLRDYLKLPIRIHSGFRTPDTNTGVKKSQHLLGKAADIQVSFLDPADVYAEILQLIKAGIMDPGGVGLYRGRFVHYDIRGRNARWGGRKK